MAALSEVRMVALSDTSTASYLVDVMDFSWVGKKGFCWAEKLALNLAELRVALMAALSVGHLADGKVFYLAAVKDAF